MSYRDDLLKSIQQQIEQKLREYDGQLPADTRDQIENFLAIGRKRGETARAGRVPDSSSTPEFVSDRPDTHPAPIVAKPVPRPKAPETQPEPDRSTGVARIVGLETGALSWLIGGAALGGIAALTIGRLGKIRRQSELLAALTITQERLGAQTYEGFLDWLCDTDQEWDAAGGLLDTLIDAGIVEEREAEGQTYLWVDGNNPALKAHWDRVERLQEKVEAL
ncbi:hypothetical protein [Cucumibacter marinus]|uniref:hypothetical protein n=1 Tax=Cucumibacter marinus TaxID=1121252 RepID=UPI0012DE4754|nr:hypothetical protein [Cucumibacter marinus]